MNKIEIEDYLINYLLDEMGKNLDYTNYDNFEVFRSLINCREPKHISSQFINIQDKYLKNLIEDKGIIDYKNHYVKDNIYLIQGDITLLNTDCIVNAANKYMLGCFIPCHKCIDNAIHTFSGVQLRLKCNDIMKGSVLQTSDVVITDAFNLPSKKIIHTVGPIVNNLTNKDRDELRLCYKNCIELAIKEGMNSIALCCISTGEYCFPNKEAAVIALEEINKHKDIDIIINVFKDEDYEIYKRLLTC